MLLKTSTLFIWKWENKKMNEIALNVDGNDGISSEHQEKKKETELIIIYRKKGGNLKKKRRKIVHCSRQIDDGIEIQ